MIQASQDQRSLLLFPSNMIGPPQKIHRCRKCRGALQMSTKDNQGEGLILTSCVNCGNYRERVYRLRVVRIKAVKSNHSVPCRVDGCPKGTIQKPGGNGMCCDCRKLNDRWEASLKRLPAPFVEVGGVLMRNPARGKKAAPPK